MNGTRISSLLGKITVILALCCCSMSAQAKYGGGSGIPEDPYLIYDANHMQAIGADANDWDKHFKLMADIDLGQFTGTEYNIIGERYYDEGWVENPFSGVFDGNNHTISNFTYSSNDEDYVGIFGFVNNGEIRNVVLIDAEVDTGEMETVGSLVADVWGYGTISNCYAKNVNVRGGLLVGGLVGAVGEVLCQATISNCYATGNVKGRNLVGGLVGMSFSNSIITKCYANVSVSGNENVGGLVGSNFWGGSQITSCYANGSVDGNGVVGGLAGSNGLADIYNCYSTCNVTGKWEVGGLVGWNRVGEINNCYSVGSVVGDVNVGGLVGENGDCTYCYVGVITNSYWDIETSGESNMCGSQSECSSGCDPNYGKTTDEMKQQSTFEGWDFVNVWGIGENQTYPYLRRYSAGDINKDGIVNFKDFAIMALQWLEEYNLGNLAPEVVITYPEDGERLMVGGVPPQTLIMAQAGDNDGAVVRVEFFDDGNKLGEDTDGSDGWNYLWMEYSLGWHTLTAVAWDNEGLSGMSAPVTVEVWMPDPPPP